MTNAEVSRSVHVRIAGRVQGVGYRAWTERRARELGLSGWVGNRRDGDVEAVFCGAAAAVDAMLASCRQGPRHARVTGVTIIGPAAPVTGGFASINDL